MNSLAWLQKLPGLGGSSSASSPVSSPPTFPSGLISSGHSSLFLCCEHKLVLACDLWTLFLCLKCSFLALQRVARFKISAWISNITSSKMFHLTIWFQEFLYSTSYHITFWKGHHPIYYLHSTTSILKTEQCFASYTN